MMGRTSLLGCILAGAAILASSGSAAADDTLRVAIAHRGAWELAAAELGQHSRLQEGGRWRDDGGPAYSGSTG